MKIKKTQLREIIRTVIKEEEGYKEFFKKQLKKSGKDLGKMSDEETKKFFDKIDRMWDAKNEQNLKEEKINSKKKIENFVNDFEEDIIRYIKDNGLERSGRNGVIDAVNHFLNSNNLEADGDAVDKIIDQINWSSSYMY